MTAPEQMLKPCPFCKRGDGSLDLSLSLCGHYFVDCGCNAQGPWERTKAEAIAAWNTRPAPAELVEALEAAVTKLEAERDELLCSFCRTDNGVPDRSTLSEDDAPFVEEFETVIAQARTALRNAGAAS